MWDKWWIKIFIGHYNPLKEVKDEDYIDDLYSRIIENSSSKTYLNAKSILKYELRELELNQLKEEKEKLLYKKTVLKNNKVDNSTVLSISMCSAGVAILVAMLSLLTASYNLDIKSNYFDKAFVWVFMVSFFVLLFLVIRVTLKGLYKITEMAKEIAFCQFRLEIIKELLKEREEGN